MIKKNRFYLKKDTPKLSLFDFKYLPKIFILHSSSLFDQSQNWVFKYISRHCFKQKTEPNLCLTLQAGGKDLTPSL